MAGRWLVYASIWLGMLVLGEIGQAIGPGYTWGEAITGMIAEAVYVPLAAWVTKAMLIGC